MGKPSKVVWQNRYSEDCH